MLRRTIIGLTAGLLLLASTASVAFAAQGQITEVNPSGVTGIIVEDGTGDEVRFVLPPPKRPDGLQPAVGVDVFFTKDCRGNHCFATGVTSQTRTQESGPSTGGG